jgi:hypothetical protein
MLLIDWKRLKMEKLNSYESALKSSSVSKGLQWFRKERFLQIFVKISILYLFAWTLSATEIMRRKGKRYICPCF